MQDLKTLLDTLNVPIAYSHFNCATTPPFLTYRRISTENFSADNKVYKKMNNYYVELYTDLKDVILENELENLFDNNDIFWEVESEDYIDDQQMYQIIYAINFEGGLING